MDVVRPMSEPEGDADPKGASPADPFPSTDFDPWAETYDQDVVSENVFPFDGYEAALETIVSLAEPHPGMSVLELGTGTGNLARRFAEHGCDLWCTDFSQAMLDKARLKLPRAHFIRHDLREAWPKALERRFDRVVSAYVFHHFDLKEKVSLCGDLVTRRLGPGGKLIMADISFEDNTAMDRFAGSLGDRWEVEPYWLADESIKALADAGLKVEYRRISACAGVYQINWMGNLRVES